MPAAVNCPVGESLPAGAGKNMSNKSGGADTGAPIPRPLFQRVTGIQLMLLLPVVLVLAWQDARSATAVLLGGLTGVLPQAWYAWYAFRAPGSSLGQRVTQRLMKGEAIKIGMAALMCAAVFRLIPGLQAGVFFVALLVITVLGWWITARVVTTRV